MDRKIYRQIEDRQMDNKIHIQMDRKIDIQMDRKIYRWIERYTYRQIDQWINKRWKPSLLAVTNYYNNFFQERQFI